MKQRRSRHLLYLLTTVALAIASCNRLPLYSHFESVDDEGWQRTDSVCFVVPQLAPGSYGMTLTLRTTSRYPYTHLALVLRCRDKAGTFTRTDTITIPVTDADGTFLGRGTAIHEYTMPLPAITLDTLTSLTLTVAHGMSHQALPGIADLGLSVAPR